jgi:hypothetical protein
MTGAQASRLHALVRSTQLAQNTLNYFRVLRTRASETLALQSTPFPKFCCIITLAMERFSVICPCCEAALTIDAATGAILAHEEKKKVHGSFEDLKGELSKQKELRDQLFAQEMSSMKDRERLLDEKFKEALKRADTDSDKPFKNPLDLD